MLTVRIFCGKAVKKKQRLEKIFIAYEDKLRYNLLLLRYATLNYDKFTHKHVFE